MIQNVLDKGFIEVVDSLGDDLTVVNSARVSFGKRKKKWDKSDEKLVRFLAPEFVMRQWYKHVVGIETSSSSSTKDHAWNEISGRYVPVEDFYTPEVFRQQSEDNKQATEGAVKDQDSAKHHWEQAMFHAKEQYQKLLNMGVGKEQARAILPLNQYTEVYWTASFQAVMNFIELRNEKTSQWEIQEYAKVLLELMHNTFPKITEIWSEAHNWK